MLKSKLEFEVMVMLKETFSFPSAAGDCRIEAVRFLPEDGRVRGTLQLLHGMQEHIGRYDGMAAYFTARGWAVYGHSHIGHGHSTTTQYPLGYFGRKNAEGRIFRADARQVHNRAKADYPDLPMVLFGYSMGSFVCRHCLADFGEELSAAVVCATGNGSPALNLGIFSAGALSLAFGRKDADLIDGVVQKGFAERTEKKTKVDWLSTDLGYLLKNGKPDPLCGFPFSYRGYYDLLTMIRAMLRAETFAKTPLDLPILFLSGGDDPVGGYGEGVKDTLHRYRETGHRRTEMKLYPGRRHEIHLDNGRLDVWADMSEFLERAVIF